jgi:hypothetical protein
MLDLYGKTSSTDRAARVRSIKEWARDLLRLSEDATLMVTELHCSEPGCPPLETVIAVLSTGETTQLKIHKPIEDVTRADIEQQAAQNPRCGH